MNVMSLSTKKKNLEGVTWKSANRSKTIILKNFSQGRGWGEIKEAEEFSRNKLRLSGEE